MKALILAAGRGERLRPLTDTTPKPLIKVGGKPLIGWHLEKLERMGVRDVIVNTSWLADRFPSELGDGEDYGLRLHFVNEGPVPLETGGGMLNARSLLGGDPFIAVNGDIWTDFDFARLPARPAGLAHLVMVDNPPHHPGGDFALGHSGQLAAGAGARLTFAGIGIYDPALLDDWQRILDPDEGSRAQPPRFKLAPLLIHAMAQDKVTGEHFQGAWTDVGTQARLDVLRESFTA